jgi:hypothetical protein
MWTITSYSRWTILSLNGIIVIWGQSAPLVVSEAELPVVMEKLCIGGWDV